MLGEVHHVRWWGRDNAPTSVGNGILLCWYHHDLVHQRNLAIRWEPGGWTFRRMDGSVVRSLGAPPGGPPDLGQVSGSPVLARRAAPGAPPPEDDCGPGWADGSQQGLPDQGELVLAG